MNYNGRLLTYNRQDDALQGAILSELIYEPQTIEALAARLQANEELLRAEVIRLHLLHGAISPIMKFQPRGIIELYTEPHGWELSAHGKYHSQIVEGCNACRMRESRLVHMGQREAG